MPDFAEPDWTRCILFAGVICLLWLLTGRLKQWPMWREGDIRKVNHISAFAGGAFIFGWLPEPTARGSLYLVSLLLLAMVACTCRFRNNNWPGLAFAANTRRSDAPYEAIYFWSSWLVSILGMLAIDLLFGNIAVTRTAALIVGIADGVAEPVGRRFGRYFYNFRFSARRSVEGSSAVFASTLAIMLLAVAHGSHPFASAVLVATAVSLVEALSPKGTDNLSIPLVAAILVHSLLRAGWIG